MHALKMHRPGLALALAALTLTGMWALAPDLTPAWAADEIGRYTMSPADDGFVRLDTKTGVMALCRREDSGDWACKDMADGQRKLRDELHRLEQENSALKDEIRGLEETLGLADGGGKPHDSGTTLRLPSEEDVDKAFDYLERMAKKLHERMDKLEKEHGRKPGTEL